MYENRMLLLKGFNTIVVQSLDLSNVMYKGCLILWLNGLSRKLWSNAQEMVRPELCTYDLNWIKNDFLNVLWIKPQKGKKQTCNAT